MMLPESPPIHIRGRGICYTHFLVAIGTASSCKGKGAVMRGLRSPAQLCESFMVHSLLVKKEIEAQNAQLARGRVGTPTHWIQVQTCVFLCCVTNTPCAEGTMTNSGLYHGLSPCRTCFLACGPVFPWSVNLCTYKSVCVCVTTDSIDILFIFLM